MTSRELFLTGDPAMLRRMIRKAIENASHFAKETISLLVANDETGGVTLTIRDDGNGFTEEGIRNFGSRRIGRHVDFSVGRNLSLGLGSVILCKIAENYGGSVTPRNWKSSDGKMAGGELCIKFPPLFSKTQLKSA